MALQLSWCASLCTPSFPAAGYEALRQRVAASTPFNHLGWLRAAEAALQPGQQLQVLLGHLDGRLCLCLPLVRERQPLGPLNVPVVRHLGHPLSDRIALLPSRPPGSQRRPALQAAPCAQAHRRLRRTGTPDHADAR